MHIVFVLLVIVSISPSIKAIPPYGFTIDMIHRDSPLSPFYDPSMNQYEVLKNAFMRSITRVNTLLFHLNNTTHGIKSKAPIISSDGDYFMKFSVGNPPVDSFGLIDTGSDLLWIQCEPCEDCYPQNSPIFDPSKSSTYQKIYCDSNICDLVDVRTCGDERVCRYEINYVDESIASGELGRDTISFGTSPQVVSLNISFGCGHVNHGIYNPASTGIVGLARRPLSMVSQLGYRIGHKFAYCLVPRYSEVTTKLTFGSDATISGNKIVTVPMIDKAPYSFYNVRVRLIYFNHKYVVRPRKNSAMLLDSGSSLTYLETSLYENVETAVREAIGYFHEPVKDPPTPLTLCYHNITLDMVPEIVFIFDGANLGLKLNTYNAFAVVQDEVCFLMAPTKGYSVLGSTSQVNFKILYDLQANRVSFASTDCTRE